MKVLNISTIIPLDGLKRENDIVIRVQNFLEERYDYEFKIAKSLPYVNKFLAARSKKWKKYQEYQNKGVIDVQGFQTLVFSWLAPPTSVFWVNYILLPFNWFFFRKYWQEKLAPWAINADLFLAQNTIPDAVIAYWLHRKFKKPYILNIRGAFNKKIISLPLFSGIFNNAAGVITHSPTNYKKLRNSIDIKLLPHPVDKIFFSKKEIDFSTIRVISVCRLLSLKNLDWVINVLAQLSSKGYQFEYHIVGDGPELLNLKQLVKNNNLSDSVFFHGYKNQAEVSSLLKKSHIFIMPSFPETLGRSFLEASAAGCLCIGHKNTGVDGLFIHKESALFVDKSTIFYEIEKLFLRFSKDYLEPYIEASQQIVQQLTWEKIGEKYNAIYMDAVKKVPND